MINIQNLDISDISYSFLNNIIESVETTDKCKLDNKNSSNPHNVINNKNIPLDPANKKKKLCKNCNGSNFITNITTKDLICTNCGYSIEVLVDCIGDWKSWSGGDTNMSSNLVTNTLLPQTSLSTSISGLTNSRLRNLHNWNYMPDNERSLYVILNYIDSKCKILKLLRCVCDSAKIFYKIVIDNNTDEDLNKKSKKMKRQVDVNVNSETLLYHTKLDPNIHKIITRGQNKIGIIGACVYYACKKAGYTKTIKEVANVFGIKTSCLNNGCKIVGLCIKKSNIQYDINLSFPSQYIKNICSVLDIKPSYCEIIKTVVKKVEDNHLVSSHTPYSVAIVCVIIVLEDNHMEISKKDFSKKLDISSVTLHKTYDTIQQYKSYLLGYEDKLDESLKLSQVLQISQSSVMSDSSNNIHDIHKELQDKLERVRNIDITQYNKLVNIDIYDYVFTTTTNSSIMTSKIINKIKFLI